jgi:hypothetical protein
VTTPELHQHGAGSSARFAGSNLLRRFWAIYRDIDADRAALEG